MFHHAAEVVAYFFVAGGKDAEGVVTSDCEDDGGDLFFRRIRAVAVGVWEDGDGAVGDHAVHVGVSDEAEGLQSGFGGLVE